ncbi:hypothetical protein AKJ16_DCAP05598, partial [Drosera capensis]
DIIVIPSHQPLDNATTRISPGRSQFPSRNHRQSTPKTLTLVPKSTPKFAATRMATLVETEIETETRDNEAYEELLDYDEEEANWAKKYDRLLDLAAG